MDTLTNILGMKVQYQNWDKKNYLPLYMIGSYDFQSAMLNDCKCLILTPTGELDTLPALKKQIKIIREIEDVPVVIKLRTMSFYRRQSMIENKIPFITNKQAFLPFMGAFLTREDEEPTKQIEKLKYSTQQLVLLYLYSDNDRLYISEVANKLPFTAMTLSRAVKELEMLDLFNIAKEGVRIVIESNIRKKELFERIRCYLSSPIRSIGYIKKVNITDDMLIAGESALAEKTMLNPSRVATYAIYAKGFDKKYLTNELVDPAQQVRLELWEYAPKQFAQGNIVDTLSLVLTLYENEDERIEEAIDELLKGVWGENG